MANLSPDERAIIAKHPLDIPLDRLRDSLRKIEQSYKPGSLSYDGAVDSLISGPQKAISKLLWTLTGHEFAFSLRSKTGNGVIASELFTLFSSVCNGDFSYEDYRALSLLVIKQAPDVDIWNALLNLITTVSRTTPPTSIPVSFDGTTTHSSASQQGVEQTHELVEGRIFEEIKSCTYRNVGGFFSKYFEGKDWTEQTKEIYRTVQNRHAGGRWTGFPDPPVQNAVLEWLFRFQEEFLSDARGVYYTSESSKDLTGAEARRQLDIFIKRKSNVSRTAHNWKDVQVIGEHKTSNSEDFKPLLLQLGRNIRDVFTGQPTRRFIHGFFLYGTTMELWVFDRSGPYSSGEFDIHKEPEQFIRAIAGYAMMSDEELGLDTFAEWDGEDRFITITEDATGKERRLQLESHLIAYQRAIVCRGTSCFRASIPSSEDPLYVVKFSWTSDKRRPEADLLRLARERGVEGVVKLFGDHRITSIADMREGLTFAKRHAFRNGTLSPSSTFSQSQPQSLLSQPFGQHHGLSIVRESPKKRKSVDAGGSRSKRSRLNSQSPDKAKPENELAYTVEHCQTNLYAHDESSFDNRTFRCLVISPAGRAIRNFRSIPELLEALRDAIKAHRSLYTAGKILHSDISENNIIITDPKEAGGFTGMLIDADLAEEIGSGRSGACHQTGTLEFMAIQVLRRISHTYRHDLESFFYVFLWICARRTWEREFLCSADDAPWESRLERWYSGSYDVIAAAKRGDMGVDGFEEILEEFPQALDCVKPLCRKIQGILFPYENGLVIGTPPGPPEKLYDPIIGAFDTAVADMA
ncbi:1 protein kinase [Lasallia pustulata]|uniref:1 protein kinase n=1 Tax=Lasallia pustulata TaxID=136370 RepID=A0A1W5DDT7_9LECA|nr:1 protein kinase [Lasallia pustulata]